LLKEEASTINYFLKWPIIRPIPRELIDDFIQKLKRKKDRESDTDYVKIG